MYFSLFFCVLGIKRQHYLIVSEISAKFVRLSVWSRIGRGGKPGFLLVNALRKETIKIA